MRSVYVHFSTNIVIQENDSLIEIQISWAKIYPQGSDEVLACSVYQTQKDELILEGNNTELLSNLAVLIQQARTVKRKDIRKFLDGIYVSETVTVQQADMNKI